jgi:hypothetical protein
MLVELPAYEGVVSCSGGVYGSRDFQLTVDRGDSWVARLTDLSVADARRIADAFEAVRVASEGVSITVSGLADGALTVQHIVGDVFTITIDRAGREVSVEVWGPQVDSLAEVLRVLLGQVERTPELTAQPF